MREDKVTPNLTTIHHIVFIFTIKYVIKHRRPAGEKLVFMLSNKYTIVGWLQSYHHDRSGWQVLTTS